MHVPRGVASRPKAAENPDAVLRAGAGMLPLGFKAGGGLALPCGHQVPHLDVPMVLAGGWPPLASSQCSACTCPGVSATLECC